MIRELKTSEHVLTDEQQVEAVIKSLPKSWEHMVVNMRHNESVKTFDDIVHHLELEAERVVVPRLKQLNPVLTKTSGFKCNRKFFKKNKRFEDVSKKEKIETRKKFKRAKKDKSKLKCYNCGN